MTSDPLPPPEPLGPPKIPQAMPPNDPVPNTYACRSCGANWSQDQWTEECDECGGGAMDRACLICGGRCTKRWNRAVMDSWDASEAHWIGACGLPRDEINQIIKDANS